MRVDDEERVVVRGGLGRGHLHLGEAHLLQTFVVRVLQRAKSVGGGVADALQHDVRTVEPQVELLDEIYGAEPAQLLQIIRMAEVSDPERLMLVGHNPGMHELALMLAGSGDAAAKKSLEDNLPTAGLAILDFAIDDWSDVAFRRGKLVRFTSPKLLKQALDD